MIRLWASFSARCSQKCRCGWICSGGLARGGVSSLAAMLNAASTIFTMDIYKKYLSPKASQGTIVMLDVSAYRLHSDAIFLAPQLGNPKISNSIFTLFRKARAFVSRRAGGICIRAGCPAGTGLRCGRLVTNFIVYGGLKYVSTVSKLMEMK